MDMQGLKYPIYIISKGRAYKPMTANFLKHENIPFFIAVEPQEYNEYCKAVGKKYVLKLPFSNLNLGSYPARNYCWNHSLKNKHERHFLFDDNIRGFRKLNKGKRIKCSAKEALLSLQNFTDKYENIAISGYHYAGLLDRSIKNPFSVNTKVYSGMLIKNDLNVRWRLKYNEDVDLCLQVLDKKWCTVNLYIYLIEKTSTTAKMKGGNQTDLYQGNKWGKKILKTKSLEEIWSQYVRSTVRYGRPHHQVSWRKYFKHSLIRKLKYK
jgi:hypothetical protein